MATPFQLDANRRNAQFSTGPRTQAGKSASSRNSTKHNLAGTTFVVLPGEDIDAFERLSREYRDEWKPRTPHESFLVNSMVQARWRLDRIARMEAEAFDQLLNAPVADGKTDEAALVALYPMRGQLLDKLHRYAREIERAYHRAAREFRACRKPEPTAKRNEPNPLAQAERAVERNEPNLPLAVVADHAIAASVGPNPATAREPVHALRATPATDSN